MAEPIIPEAYLAIAATVHDVVNIYNGNKRVEQNHKPSNINFDGSKPTVALPTDELLSYAGLKTGNDGYVQLVPDSPAHPRNWSRGRKAYDFTLTLFSEFFMSGISAAGTPASFDGDKVLGQRREVGLVAFTTMYGEVYLEASFYMHGKLTCISGTCSDKLWVLCYYLRTLTSSDAGHCISAQHSSTVSSAYQ